MKKIFKPIQIGSLGLKNNVIAAPMAGLSSLPYRLLAIENGCGLAFSEMISAEGIIRVGTKTQRYFENMDDVRPFGVQVFGANPTSMSKAISFLEDKDLDLIDINMGCPVRKVCSKGAGAAMMKDLKRAAEVIATARAATKRPLTVKMRSGWDEDNINCIELASIAEDLGVDAVTIHPRTQTEFFKGHSDWEIIARVKSKLKIPVIGNGDIKSRIDAIKMMADTGCDAVMIGRAAIGNPWIFRQVLEDGYAGPSIDERGGTAVRHLELLKEHLGEKIAVLNMRTQLSWYFKGMHGVKKFMEEVNHVRSFEELKKKMEGFFYYEN